MAALGGVFVAGASGVLGRSLVPALLRQGFRVRGLARSRQAADVVRSLGAQVVEMDLLEANIVELSRAMAGCASVVHAATAIPKRPSPTAWDLNSRVRIEGTRNLLHAAVLARVNRYVQQSVSMVYADGGDAWLDESAPFDDSPARAPIVGPVAAMEKLIRDVPAGRMETVVLRGGQFVGPGTFEDWTRAALRDGSLRTSGTASRYLSTVAVPDMAAAVVLALRLAPSGSIFNVNSEPQVHWNYVQRLAREESVEPRITYTGGDAPSHRCSALRITSQLGWHDSKPH